MSKLMKSKAAVSSNLLAVFTPLLARSSHMGSHARRATAAWMATSQRAARAQHTQAQRGHARIPSKKPHAASLSMTARGVLRPHPDKQRGEDAYFIREAPTFVALGIADGVGGWAAEGIDAGEYARALMRHAEEKADQPQLRAQPALLLDAAHKAIAPHIQGSCTACIVVLENEVLHVANLGDSGVLGYRQELSAPFFRTKEQQHRFNCPLQLGSGGGGDEAASADKSQHQVRHGDILVLATDGFLDNLFDHEIMSTIRTFVSHAEQKYLLPKAAKDAATAAATGGSIKQAPYVPDSHQQRSHLHTLAGASSSSSSSSSAASVAALTSSLSRAKLHTSAAVSAVSASSSSSSSSPASPTLSVAHQSTASELVSRRVLESLGSTMAGISNVAAPSASTTTHSLTPAQLQKLAETLVDAAATRAADPKARTPFSDNARTARKRYIGGKPDDITVVVAQVFVQQTEEPSSSIAAAL